MTYQSGRHFLQIPGPANVPDRVLRAMAAPTIDHRGPEFASLARRVLAGVARLCGTARPVALYPSSGTGAWEAALVNTLSPGDRVLAFETGHFATLWAQMAGKFGLDVDLVPGDWRRGVQAGQVGEKLAADPGHQIKAVTIVHNETSTGCASQIPLIRAAMDDARHPALLIVDTISSLGSVEYRHDEWGVDVTIWCSQKGMMLPPGLDLNAISEKALAAAARARLPRSYWDWPGRESRSLATASARRLTTSGQAPIPPDRPVLAGGPMMPRTMPRLSSSAGVSRSQAATCGMSSAPSLRIEEASSGAVTAR